MNKIIELTKDEKCLVGGGDDKSFREECFTLCENQTVCFVHSDHVSSFTVIVEGFKFFIVPLVFGSIIGGLFGICSAKIKNKLD